MSGIYTGRSKVDRSSTRRSRVDLRRRHLYWSVQGGSVQYQAVQSGPATSTSVLSGPRWIGAGHQAWSSVDLQRSTSFPQSTENTGWMTKILE